MKYLILLILIFSLIFFLNRKKESLISPKVFTKGILLGENTLQKEIRLIRNMEKSNGR